MALIKKHVEQEVQEFQKFTSLQDAIDFFHVNDNNPEKRDYAIEEIVGFEGGAAFLIDCLNDENSDKQCATKVAAVISNMDSEDVPIETIMDLLKLKNAYIRNLGISMLRNFGDSIKYYIVKFLIGDDRDLRIFAINVLGDVDFSESREMLLELLENEKDINVAMTAVDYMGEIGDVDDIPLLNSLKERFNGDIYAKFAVDGAVSMIKG
jgi:HEAT repeat protein